MNRGVLRSKIFSTEQDDDAFVSILSEMQLRIPIRILAVVSDAESLAFGVMAENGKRNIGISATGRRDTCPALARQSRTPWNRGIIPRSIQSLCGGRECVSVDGIAICGAEPASGKPGG